MLCNPTGFFFGFPFLLAGSQEAFLPAIKTLLLQVWVSFITASPCIELLLSLLTGLIRKQGPLVEVGLNHPHISCLVCLVLLPLGEQPPGINCVLVPGWRPAAAMSSTPEQDIRGQQAPLLLPRFIQRQRKGKNLSQRLGAKSFPAHSKIVQNFLLLNNCSVQEADLGIYHIQLNHVKSAQLNEPTWRISTAQKSINIQDIQTVTREIQGIIISCERIFIYESVIKSPCNVQRHPLLQLYQAGMQCYNLHKQDAERCSGHWWSQEAGFFIQNTWGKAVWHWKLSLRLFTYFNKMELYKLPTFLTTELQLHKLL